MKSPLEVDVYFDLICPWCLIGKRNLEHAVRSLWQDHPELPVTLRWHSVQLLPDVPEEGVDFMAFYLNRLGGEGAVRARQAQVLEAARRAGARIDYARIARMPNTRKAHQLIAFVAAQSDAGVEAVIDDLLEAYFVDGKDLTDVALLQTIAAKYGHDPEAFLSWVVAQRGLPATINLTGVPFFVLNRTHAVSGAQVPDVLLQAMRDAMHHAQRTACPT